MSVASLRKECGEGESEKAKRKEDFETHPSRGLLGAKPDTNSSSDDASRIEVSKSADSRKLFLCEAKKETQKNRFDLSSTVPFVFTILIQRYTSSTSSPT